MKALTFKFQVGDAVRVKPSDTFPIDAYAGHTDTISARDTINISTTMERPVYYLTGLKDPAMYFFYSELERINMSDDSALPTDLESRLEIYKGHLADVGEAAERGQRRKEVRDKEKKKKAVQALITWLMEMNSLTELPGFKIRVFESTEKECEIEGGCWGTKIEYLDATFTLTESFFIDKADGKLKLFRPHGTSLWRVDIKHAGSWRVASILDCILLAREWQGEPRKKLVQVHGYFQTVYKASDFEGEWPPDQEIRDEAVLLVKEHLKESGLQLRFNAMSSKVTNQCIQ